MLFELKSLRNLRCSSHCGIHETQLHQTRVTRVTCLQATRLAGCIRRARRNRSEVFLIVNVISLTWHVRLNFIMDDKLDRKWNCQLRVSLEFLSGTSR